MDNPDGFHGSSYLHKALDDDSKWIAGPIWDLVCYNREKTDYTFKMRAHYGFTPHWIGEIIQYDSFCKAVAKALQEVYPTGLSGIYDYINDTILPLGQAWSNDCERWKDDASQTAEYRAERIKTGIERNIEWFDCHLPVSPYASVNSIYDIENDGSIKVYNLQGMVIGEFNTLDEAVSALKAGIYIINGKKIKLHLIE